jgi:hypothetical protein
MIAISCESSLKVDEARPWEAALVATLPNPEELPTEEAEKSSLGGEMVAEDEGELPSCLRKDDRSSENVGETPPVLENRGEKEWFERRAERRARLGRDGLWGVASISTPLG